MMLIIGFIDQHSLQAVEKKGNFLPKSKLTTIIPIKLDFSVKILFELQIKEKYDDIIFVNIFLHR